MPHPDPGLDLRKHTGPLGQNNEHLGPTVCQLVFELRGCIERVDVDHHHPGPPDPEQGHGVLQQIGQHNGDPVPGADPGQALQPGGKAPVEDVELPVADSVAKITEGWPAGKTRQSPVGHVHDRLGGIKIKGGGHTRWVLA